MKSQWQVNVFPDVPKFDEAFWDRCRDTKDYAPALFEWYKFVGGLNVVVANIMPDSPGYRDIPETHYKLLAGLLSRCSRLMLANVALSSERKFGETTVIIDRCIFDCSIRIQWLCASPSDEKFRAYYADGLKAEVEFKKQIQLAIADRGNVSIPIEDRMLRSIERHFRLANLDESEIIASKRLPDLATMMKQLGYDRLIYVIGQRLGSHHIHGGWTNLLMYFLEPDDNEVLVPSSKTADTHINQFMWVSLMVLKTLGSYVHFVFGDTQEAEGFCKIFASTRDEIRRIYSLAIGDNAENDGLAGWARMPGEASWQ